MDIRPAIASESEGRVTLRVYIQPKAAHTECVGLHGDAVKIRVAAPPIDGLANEELIRFLAERCEIPRRRISIQVGATSRQKQVNLAGVSAEWVLARLIPPRGKG
ncbi:MAG: DUF167 family protein [Nitrospira sp.]|nr:DUF167 family protein [Nitrospira sp.]MCP9441190.1 DUF167 family protein [Nitrospira sp.]